MVFRVRQRQEEGQQALHHQNAENHHEQLEQDREIKPKIAENTLGDQSGGKAEGKQADHQSGEDDKAQDMALTVRFHGNLLSRCD